MRARAAPIQVEGQGGGQTSVKYHKFDSKLKRTKRMSDNCHSSGAMRSDSAPDSWEDLSRRSLKHGSSQQRCSESNAESGSFWLTWLVRLRNRCELQLRNWCQGRGWGLTDPKTRWRLWQWLGYGTASKQKKTVVSHFLEWRKAWTNIWDVSVPWWATMTDPCDGEKPTYPWSQTAEIR